MDELVRHIQFPLYFDSNRLKEDVQKVMNTNWVDHYNQNDYDGKWTSIALMSANGKSDNIYAFNFDSKEIIATEALEVCTYFKEILDSFHFDKAAVRLLNLSAGAQIKPHSDHCLGYEDGFFRLHIPIITNPNVIFILDSKRLIMNEGECWYINANFTHSVANNGSEDRIHLVIDGIRNDWSDQLFFENHTENQFQKPVPEMDEKTKQLVIEQLKLMNTDVANEMIEKLSK
ncbi:aspartyl/asparaginyl beta-hydroxylase domain-containing protein [Flavobacterium sp.]|uniref:aspartyl/asparaginyl beta-hydroxylase domain-containing protein n=1 Tax=Flavobacterium sp. TaxID=239 RepID=UPI002B4ADFEA|nr:aspartyl/asparaginyl beta-hydroxylase domain-containing protein [Flavobacterium sp.]HLP63636.1 aspartyl/asparaginyl beta-hydroxylase domain-containing protein [Flavobacterium sp.]